MAPTVTQSLVRVILSAVGGIFC